MKTKILAITIFVIGAFIACKKVGENIIDTKYSDVELNIDKKSAFAEEERKIKEGLMAFPQLTIDDRKAIVKGIIMDNKNVANLVGNVMPIINKLKKEDIIPFFKILIPNSNFVINDGDRVVATYHADWLPCDFYDIYYNKKYTSWYVDHCKAKGEDACFKYNPCP